MSVWRVRVFCGRQIKYHPELIVFVYGLAHAAYTCTKPCSGNMCCSIPSDNLYYLTTFCDATTACGIPCSARPNFAADSQRFGCRKNISICKESGSPCVKVIVTDAGPNISVEKSAGRPIIDASKSVCQQLFGSSSCGWSDKKGIKATVASDSDGRDYGYFEPTEQEMIEMEKYHNMVYGSDMLD